jgi:uncharacterized membrane protein YfcA
MSIIAGIFLLSSSLYMVANLSKYSRPGQLSAIEISVLIGFLAGPFFIGWGLRGLFV